MRTHFILKMAGGQAVSAFLFVLSLCCGLVCSPTAVAQETTTQSDILAKLVHPEVAERLSLTDAQRARFQTLLLERSENLLAATSQEARTAVLDKYDQLALAEMTEEQKSKLATDQPNQKLMFQFRDMKWDQVLTWFAAQQDLTLVMDRVPPGSFTYSDSRSYSPAEAVDLLNSILITRGYTLVRREKMLMVTELSDAIPVELLPRVQLEQLPERGRFELVSVVFPLDGRPVDTVVNEIKPYLNSFGRVLPLARGTQVLVIENAGKMQTINELIASVPIPKAAAQPSPAPGPIFAAYSIGNLDATKTLDIIRRLIPSENITVDADTAVLSAFVVPSQQTAIKTALDTMLEKQAALPEMQVVAYLLKGITDEQFRTQVASIAPSARIMTTRDRALVVASPTEHPLIRQSLVALDIQPVDTEQEVRTFELRRERVAEIEAALKVLIPKSRVASSESTGTLIVKGSLDELRNASELIELLSREDEPVRLNIYTLTPMQIRRRAIISSLPGDLSELKLQDGSKAAELLVWGTDKHHALFSEFLKQLDQPEIPSELPVPQVYPLNVADSAVVLQLLTAEYEKARLTLNSEATQLTVVADAQDQESIAKRLAEFHERLPARPELTMAVYQLAGWTAAALQQALQTELANERVQIDSQQDRLLVWATPDRHERISELLAVLAQNPLTEVKKFEVPVPRLSEIETSLRSMIPKSQIVSNPATGNLLLKGSPDDLRTASEMIELLSREDEPVRLKIYALTPTQIRRRAIISSLPGDLSELKLQDGSKAAELLVWGTDKHHALFSEFLKQLDQPEIPSELPVPQVYPLNVADSAVVLQLLTAEYEKARFTLNSEATQLTVVADAQDQESIAKRLAEFHERLPARPELTMAVYQLAGWTAAALQQALQTELANERVQVDSQQDRLLVWATLERHTKIEELVTALGREPEVERQKVAVVYSLQYASASTTKSVLDQLSKTATIVADDNLKKVVITATVADHSVFQPIIAQMDRAKSVDETPGVQAFDVGTLQASQILPALQALFPEMKLSVESTANKIIATGTNQEIQRMTEAVNRLIESADGHPQSVKTYPVPFGEMSSLPTILSQIAPKAVISSDATSRTITVLASDEQHQRISQALEQIINTSRGNKQAVSYVVRPSQTASVQTSLRTLMPSLAITIDAVSGQVIVLASLEEHEAVKKIVELLASGPNATEKTLQVFKLKPKMLASPEFLKTLQSLSPPQVMLEPSTATDSLLAIGTPEELQAVAKRVEELLMRWPAANELTSAVYSLEHAATASAVAILQPLMPGITLAQDPSSRTIAATASGDDHRKIKELIELLDLPPKSNQVPRLYRLRPGVGQTLASSLSAIMPDARMYADASSGSLLATATEQQHQTIQAMVEEYLASEKALETRVLALTNADASTLLYAIVAWNSQIKVAADRATNSLILTGPTELLDSVSEVVAQLDKSPNGDRTTQYYSTGTAYAPTLVSALQGSLPKTIIVADTVGGGLFVTATIEDHERLGKELEQIVSAARSSKQAVSYVVRSSQTNNVQTSLRTLMPSLSITTDAITGQVIVLASPEEHQAVSKIVELLASGPNAEEKTVQVFELKPKLLDSPEFLKTLQGLVPPQVTLEPNAATDSLVAVGMPEDLEAVKKRVDELLNNWPTPNELTSAVYTLQHAATPSAIAILQPLVPGVTLAQDPTSRTVAATASEEDHRKIKELLELLDLPPKSNLIAKVYQLSQGAGRTLASSLSAMMPDARLYGDTSSGALLATATEQQHETIQAIVEQYDSYQGDRVTRFYPIENANPTTVASALQQNFPKATVAGDSGGSGLFVTASENEHIDIQQLVEELNAQPGRLPTLKTFVVQHVTPSALASSLTEAYGSRAAARVTFSENAKSVFVLGTRDELKIADQLVKMLDVPEIFREPRRFQAFSLEGMDGRGVMEALETAFENEPDRVEMQYDSSGGRLVVFGTSKQLAKVSELVESLAPLPRSMQVYPLGVLDVFVTKEAVDALFADTPYNQSPTITVDHDRQQLLVRATEEQQQQIRSLLTQLGAPTSPFQPNDAAEESRKLQPSSGQRVRKISMPFGAASVLDELRRVWPSIESNPIQVIDPRGEATKELEVNPAEGDLQDPVTSSSHLDPDVASVEPVQSPVQSPPIVGQQLEQDLSSQNLEVPSLAPPVIIVVGEKEWTIASDDTQALDQMERLLEIIRSPRLQPIVSTGNYSLYLLQRASATEMQTMLEELLRSTDARGPRLSASLSSLYRRVKIVSDNRTNALIVSGSTNDRRLIEELLGVLDSSELMGTLQQLLPTTLTLTSATVRQIDSILRDIYRSQLTTNVTRRSLPIPEGVSADVSSLLQQLNAQASSPVLSISSDEVTNSLIVRAPVDLTQEIRQFVEKLDNQTASTPSRRVELIRLESTNTKSIEQALRRLLSK